MLFQKKYMGYKETLEKLSTEILSLQSEDSVKNMRVYKNNIFNLVINLLKKDYIGTYAYLGDRNFTFFARKMFLAKKIKSANINNFLKGFSLFLDSEKETHDDDLLIDLSKIDHLWSYSNHPDIEVVRGAFAFWSSLVGEEENKPDIDWSFQEKVFSYEVNGERYLSVKK